MKMKVCQISMSNLKYTLLFLLIGSLSACLSDPAEEVDGVKALLGRGFGIANTTLLVQDLDSARTYYSEVLGFAKPRKPGFEKGLLEGTQIAPIRFPDNSSIELLALDDSLQVMTADSFLTAFLDENEGVRMYSLYTSSADSTYWWLSSRGFQVDSIRAYRTSTDTITGWDWDDGGPQVLTVDFDSINPPPHLPRFTENVGFPYDGPMGEWNSWYNMQRGFITHPNGVVSVSALQIAVEDLKSARKTLKKMGLLELKDNSSENRTSFRLKRNQELQLMAPATPDDEIAQFINERGSGVFGISFEVKDLQATYDTLSAKLSEEAFFLDSFPGELRVLREYAYGVQLQFKQESQEQAELAQKLKFSFRGALDSTAAVHIESQYIKYCALCHGENREGYAADNAPSLRSHSLMATTKSSNFLRYTIQFGREETAMAGYLKDQGGPLTYIEIEMLLKWLHESSGVEDPVELSRDPVPGDVALGAAIYGEKCTVCHGENGEGISAPAIGKPMLLATATDDFLRYAIKEGRDSTPMPAFKDSLSQNEIDAVTAFLRSRASGWNVPKNDTISLPTPEEYVLNPDSNVPDFELRAGRFVSAEQLNRALQDSLRIVLLDARSKVAWRQTHIPGAVPVPYYEEPEEFIQHMPKDSTWIVAYCACPHAASQKVINTLKRYGFKKTAIMDEGILVWADLGYPVEHGQ